MCKRLPSDLTSARTLVQGYRVKKGRGGFVIWRFKPWMKDGSGWKPTGWYSTRAQAWTEIEKRLGLAHPEEPKPAQPADPAFAWFDIYGHH